jgi:hypothetical protein
VVGVYLLIIAAARTGHNAPIDDVPMAAFARGLTRFHFFWVTLLWPWVVALAFYFVRQAKPTSPSAMRLILTMAVIAIPTAAISGAFDHMLKHKRWALWRSQTQVPCLIKSLQRGRGIQCKSLWPRSSLTIGYVHALEIGASFTRIFQIPPMEIGDDNPPPLFRLSTATSSEWRAEHVHKADRIAGAIQLSSAAGDSAEPLIYFYSNPPADLSKCVIADVNVLSSGEAKLSYQRFKRKKYERAREWHPPKPSVIGTHRFNEVTFRITSPTGFGNEFRLEFPGKQGIKEIELHCRMWTSEFGSAG